MGNDRNRAVGRSADRGKESRPITAKRRCTDLRNFVLQQDELRFCALMQTSPSMSVIHIISQQIKSYQMISISQLFRVVSKFGSSLAGLGNEDDVDKVKTWVAKSPKLS